MFCQYIYMWMYVIPAADLCLQRQAGFPAVAFVTFESWETAQNVRRAFGGNYIRRNFCPPKVRPCVKCGLSSSAMALITSGCG